MLSRSEPPDYLIFSMYKLVTLPDQILRTKAEAVDPKEITSDYYQKLVDEMIRVMHEHNGIGLAAPQVGVSERVIIVNHADGDLPVFNPELSEFSWRKITDEEGCLSIPGVYGLVKRHYKLRVRGFDRSGNSLDMPAAGLLARGFQHEVDHINGVLFIDKVEKITRGNVPKKN